MWAKCPTPLETVPGSILSIYILSIFSIFHSNSLKISENKYSMNTFLTQYMYLNMPWMELIEEMDFNENKKDGGWR